MEPPARPLATRLTAQPPTPTPRPRPRAGSSGAARCGVARAAGPAGAFASLGLARQRERRQALSSAELLVDGDRHSAFEVSQALRALRRGGGGGSPGRRAARATLFVAPGSQKLKDGLREQQQSISTVEVPRRGVQGEPNDEALVRHLRRLLNARGNVCLAILVSDAGFAQVVEEAVALGREVVVFVPELRPGVAEVFEATGAQVLRLAARHQDTAFKTRATLQGDGTGLVELMAAEPRQSCDSTPLRDFLAHYGFCGREERVDLLLPSLAKFWFMHQSHLRPALTVYPYQHAVTELLQMLAAGNKWQRYQKDLAFLFPTRGARRPTRAQVKTYGCGHALSLFRGGGPCMLHDSQDLAQRVLRRLGYLDDDLNSDLPEAIQVFCNTANNKGALRRNFDLTEGASVSTLERQLRRAFLSSSSTGMWEASPSDEAVRLQLRRAGLVTPDAPREEVLEAMRSWAKRRGLPAMRSYNGHLWQFRSAGPANPSQRDAMELKKERTRREEFDPS
ncbi:unnamed protein product [Effrenium voratum]|nr:unnamed protein product [Effrenium voratum]